MNNAERKAYYLKRASAMLTVYPNNPPEDPSFWTRSPFAEKLQQFTAAKRIILPQIAEELYFADKVEAEIHLAELQAFDPESFYEKDLPETAPAPNQEVSNG